MKAVTIKGIMADFLDSIREYEHESGKAIHFDERESSEFVDMYFNGGGKLKIEEQKPLFITDDDIEVFSEEVKIYIVNKTFYKKETEICNIYDKSNREDFKYFFHESNADKYIWRNKPVFSYEDIIDFNTVEEGMWYNIKEIAKERASNGK